MKRNLYLLYLITSFLHQKAKINYTNIVPWSCLIISPYYHSYSMLRLPLSNSDLVLSSITTMCGGTTAQMASSSASFPGGGAVSWILIVICSEHVGEACKHGSMLTTADSATEVVSAAVEGPAITQ